MQKVASTINMLLHFSRHQIFKFLGDAGAQALWELSTISVDALIQETVCEVSSATEFASYVNYESQEEAGTEALMLMRVQNNFCTPNNGEILVASTQDFLTYSFLIIRNSFCDHALFALMCCYMGDAMDPIDLPTHDILKPIELWTGKQLFRLCALMMDISILTIVNF